ncbi:MAG: aldose 1-epimerase [Polaribacter sp.]|uniref:aldose 1-epimerase n=1 Tax=Polaribacter sp. TaxID=1920175 RepID=UPI003BAEC2BA
MFRISPLSEKEKDYLILQNSNNSSSARISLHQGGSLQELKLKDIYLIKEQENFDYEVSYASSILFPFCSRIKKGVYKFKEEKYQLALNDNGKSALHGLVYDKYFEVFEPEEHQDNCSVTVNYFEKDLNIGFPFKFFISTTYTLFDTELQVRVTVKNMDTKAFPFTLGWHPYFISNQLEKSSLTFKSDKKVKFSKNLIAKKIVEINQEENFNIENKQLDDCFFLNDDKVKFTTPNYGIEISSNAKENFLQLYTPQGLPLIAIEPMTGISDSFNNKIGLQVLEPKETYVITWKVKLMK